MFRRSAAFFGKSLVVTELGANGAVSAASLSAITAAKACGPVTAIATKEAAAAVAKVADVAEVLTVDGAAGYANGLPENWAPTVASVAKSGGFTHVFAGSSAFGRGVIPRAAAKLDSMPLSDVSAVKDESTFVRATYAGNAVNTVKSSDAIKCITVRGTAFERAAAEGGSAAVKDAEGVSPASDKATWKEDQVAKSDKPDLATASVVVSGGRGFKNAENFKLLSDLAAPLKAAMGATRAVVDAGYVPNDMQVGQTGKVVAPQLYFAIGISGAIQHIAGMKDSKCIVAINNDGDAPIFSVADYGLVEDLFKAVPELTEKVKK